MAVMPSACPAVPASTSGDGPETVGGGQTPAEPRSSRPGTQSGWTRQCGAESACRPLRELARPPGHPVAWSLLGTSLGSPRLARLPITQRVRTCTNALALSCAQCLADARAAAHASSGAAPSNRAKYGRFLPPTGGLAQAG